MAQEAADAAHKKIKVLRDEMSGLKQGMLQLVTAVNKGFVAANAAYCEHAPYLDDKDRRVRRK